MIKNCMKKVIGVNINQTIRVEGLEFQAFYAGHVLGAAMFYVKAQNESVLYTGDYNMTPDRHLGSALADKIKPDLLITETTYATTIRDSKRCRERDFLKKIHQCVEKGGKVLIPVFALGRAQELCILLETYWERMNMNVPIYFSAGLVEKANLYYKLFINWTNQKIKKTYVKRNMFEFRHIRTFDRSYMDQPGPMVLFATPGMLHAGMSLEVFKRWAPNELNMVILPGYCVVGTVGNKLLAGHQVPSRIEIDKKTVIDVKCQVKNMSFSAHADAKGIMQLIRHVEPTNVVLVHGEKTKMAFLQERIERELQIRCFFPPNGVSITIPVSYKIPVHLSQSLLKNHFHPIVDSSLPTTPSSDFLPKNVNSIDSFNSSNQPINAMLFFTEDQIRVLGEKEGLDELGISSHILSFSSIHQLPDDFTDQSLFKLIESLKQKLLELIDIPMRYHQEGSQFDIHFMSVSIISQSESINVSWSYEDEDLGTTVVSVVNEVLEQISSSISNHQLMLTD